MKVKFTRTCRIGDTEVSITVKTSVNKPIQEYQLREIADTVIKEFAFASRRMVVAEAAMDEVVKQKQSVSVG